jgi:hypothetical protein
MIDHRVYYAAGIAVLVFVAILLAVNYNKVRKEQAADGKKKASPTLQWFNVIGVLASLALGGVMAYNMFAPAGTADRALNIAKSSIFNRQ